MFHDGRWYDVNVPRADELFDEHLAGLEARKPDRKKWKGDG